MQANKWGPSGWTFLHMISFSYPQDPDESTRQHYKILFENLQYTLPCSHCRNSYSIIYKYIDINDYLDSREGLTYWLFLVHNLVNRKLEHNLEIFENVILKYENYRARCGSMNETEKYNKCKSQELKITLPDIQKNIMLTYSKYKEISKKHILDLYNSNLSIDPKVSS